MMMQVAVEDRELVSALADGQLRGEEFARTVERLGTVDDAQRCWHAYHLVGDVLRSGDAMVGARDAAFIQRLRDRLGQEQGLAPGEAVASFSVDESTQLTGADGTHRSEGIGANDSRFRWKLLAGVASLATVSAIGWQVMSGGDQAAASRLVQLPVPNARPELVLSQVRDGVGSEPQLMIRDPQIDALLAAHKQFGGTSALQMPAGFLRNATFEGATR